MTKRDSAKGMQSLENLLERYKERFIPPQASIEKICIEVIAEYTPFSLTADQVSYSVATKTIYIKAPSVIKTELQFYHNTILKELKSRVALTAAPEQLR